MVAESVGGSVEGDDDGAVQEPVEHRGGDGGVAEDLAQALTGRFVVITIDVFR